jgi:hypothetical protein
MGAEEACKSLRVKGAVHAHFMTKAMTKQSRLLTKLMVIALENGITSLDDGFDRVAGGFFAMQLHSRARFSDLQHCSELLEDFTDSGDGYLEARGSMVKTAISKENKKQMMPMVAPARGLLAGSWAANWMSERRIQGLDLVSFDFLLPSPGAEGRWHNHPVTSSQASAWLREILSRFGFRGTREETTHSLKSTPLSWCSKFGLDIVTRQMLGHHVPSDQTSALVYSRDAQAAPLREYQRVLESMRKSSFDPDSTRSGRFRAEGSSAQTRKRKSESAELATGDSASSAAGTGPASDCFVVEARADSCDASECDLSHSEVDSSSSGSSSGSSSDRDDSKLAVLSKRM